MKNAFDCRRALVRKNNDLIYNPDSDSLKGEIIALEWVLDL